MKTNRLRKLLNGQSTEIYYFVDESFINSFSSDQEPFMLFYYYKEYSEYCEKNKIKALPMNSFLKNAKKRKRKMIQICCPYCGYIETILVEKKYSDLKYFQYCTRCGRKSTTEFVFSQLASFIRLNEVHRAGLKALKEDHTESDIDILSYDVNHLEIVELTSILERTLREFFLDLTLVKYKAYGHSYIKDVIRKTIGNDFMLWEKANDHYKKSLGINLKTLLSDDCRSNLTDLVNIRNVVVHNNGTVDEKFKSTQTYSRISEAITGSLIFVTEEMINKYLSSVLELIASIEDEFKEIYNKEMHELIANYYFNKKGKSEEL